jgi:hypothetical protein
MSTAKDKAISLVNKFLQIYDGRVIEAKKCALNAVDLHLEELSKMKLIFSDRELHYKSWQEVKQEIENL